MKRARIFAAIAALLFFLVVGAYSKQEEQAKRLQEEQMERIDKEIDQLTLRAHQLAEKIRQAKALVEKAK
jgi:uncharacterized protein YlxW (UPF0749 family)